MIGLALYIVFLVIMFFIPVGITWYGTTGGRGAY